MKPSEFFLYIIIGNVYIILSPIVLSLEITDTTKMYVYLRIPSNIGSAGAAGCWHRVSRGRRIGVSRRGRQSCLHSVHHVDRQPPYKDTAVAGDRY